MGLGKIKGSLLDAPLMNKSSLKMKTNKVISRKQS